MKLKTVALTALIFLGSCASAQKSEDIIAYINNFRDLAVTEMQRSGIPASIILAQGIHETEAGTSELVKKSNNHFGIKCKETWSGSVVYHDDDERGECFRSYDKPEDSYRDHSDFLHSSPRYAFLFKLDPTDYQGWAYGLKKAGYATNIHYSQILIKLIEDYHLQQYTLVALGKSQEPEYMSALPRNKTDLGAGTAAKKTDIHFAQAPKYLPGIFTINRTSVIFSKAGTSLLSIANQYDIPLGRLLDFNDLDQQDVLAKDQLIYLQRKRKVGDNEFHVVQQGESLYDICQSEGIRYESLLELNQLAKGMDVAAGEKIYLQSAAPARPLLAVREDLVQRPANADHLADSPAPVTHIVRSRETLYTIAKKYGVDVEKIRRWNNLDAHGVKTGQELVIYKN